MANYYDRDDDWDSERRRYSRGGEGRQGGVGYSGTYERDRNFDDRSGYGYSGESSPYSNRYGTSSNRDNYDSGRSSGYGRTSDYDDRSEYRSGSEYGGSSTYGRGDYGRGYNYGRGSDYRAGNYGRNYDYSDYTPASERGYGTNYSSSQSRYYEGTNRPPDYGRSDEWNRARNFRDYRNQGERGWWDRASDEVASWFGDEEAERRRRYDEAQQGQHRGRGPKSYRRSDERIREDINDRLTDHAYLDASNIDVSVKDGEATLSGSVDNRRAKRIAEDLADNVSGVTHVQNNLRVSDSSRFDTTSTTTTTPAARAAKP